MRTKLFIIFLITLVLLSLLLPNLPLNLPSNQIHADFIPLPFLIEVSSSPDPFNPLYEGTTITISITNFREEILNEIKVSIKNTGREWYWQNLNLGFGETKIINIIWDGKDNAGNIVPAGTYIIYAEPGDVNTEPGDLKGQGTITVLPTEKKFLYGEVKGDIFGASIIHDGNEILSLLSPTSTPVEGKIFLAKTYIPRTFPQFNGVGMRIHLPNNITYLLGFSASSDYYGPHLLVSYDEGSTWEEVKEKRFGGWIFNEKVIDPPVFLWLKMEDIGPLPWTVDFLTGFFSTSTDFQIWEQTEAIEITPEILSEKWSFAIITDLHIGRGYPDYGTEGFEDDVDDNDYYLTKRLETVVNWIIDNKDNIDCQGTKCPIKFLAVLGDISDSAEKSEFLKAKRILDKLNDYGIPYVPVFGNHDVWPYTDKEEANSTFGEKYFDEIFWQENATNTKLLTEKFNLQKSENFSKFKNFAFSFGGINFIALDFNSREHFISPGFKTGIKATAKFWQQTKEWLVDCLQERKECLKGFERNKNIILSHIPIVKDPLNGFSETICKGEDCAYMVNEFDEIKEIIEKNSDKIFANFGGHIHGFYDWWREEWKNTNEEEYPQIGNTSVLTTEAVMVGSNEKDKYLKEHDKGIIKIVKILNENEIDYKTNEGKYNPETEEGKEFIALNPYISWAYKFLENSSNLCIFFKSHPFTHREISSYQWQFGDGKSGSGKIIPLYCYSQPGVYNVTSTLIDKETGIKEEITRKIEIKEGLVSKVIKIKNELIEKAEIISQRLTENLLDFGNYLIKGKDKLLLKIKHSSAVPVAEIFVDYEKATGDIDLSEMIFDTDVNKKKTILYMPQWPDSIEKEKALFILK